MRKCIGSALLIVVLATVPALASAQRRATTTRRASSGQRTQFGVELDWSSDVDFGVGGRGVFNLDGVFPGTPLNGILSFDYFFPSHPAGTSVTYWEINGDVAYRLHVPAVSTFRPYAGAGLNIAHASAGPSGGASVSDTKAGLNVLGGTTFKVKGSLTPFVEARGEIGGGKTFVLTGGILF